MKYGHFSERFQRRERTRFQETAQKNQRYSDLGPYRPLCMLSTFSKVFEQDIADHLATIAQDENLLP